MFFKQTGMKRMSKIDSLTKAFGNFIEFTSKIFKPFTDAASEAARDDEEENIYNKEVFGITNNDNDAPEEEDNLGL